MEDAKLIYYTQNGSSADEVEIDVYVEEVDIYGKEFYMSYQSGINVSLALKVNKYDFVETEHRDTPSGPVKYASQVLYKGSKYKIIRHQNVDKEEKILMICG